MTHQPISPAKYYENNGVVCPLVTAAGIIAVGTNQQVIVAVAGKRIRVMGWIAQGIGGITTYNFKDGSGGGGLTAGLYAPNGATAGDFSLVPVIDSGYFETSTGVGLFCDVAVAVTHLNVFYITYTP